MSNSAPTYLKKAISGIKLILITAFLVLLSLTTLYLLLGWGASKVVIAAKEQDKGKIELFLISNGKHTDIALPVKNQLKDWSTTFPYSQLRSSDTLFTHIAFGWGDKGFFIDMPTWDDLTYKLAFNALFWLNTTAMHVTYHTQLVEGGLCRKLRVGEAQYLKLIEFIEQKFKRSPQDSFIKIETDAYYGLNDTFWEANGKYSLLYSCNSWTNSALKVAGQKHLLWSFFDAPILKLYPLE